MHCILGVEINQFAFGEKCFSSIVRAGGVGEFLDKASNVGLLESLDLTFDHAGLSFLEDFGGVGCQSEFELEGELLDCAGLVVFWVTGVAFLEVEVGKFVLWTGQDFLSIELLFNGLVLWVVFKVGLEIVAVALFLL